MIGFSKNSAPGSLGMVFHFILNREKLQQNTHPIPKNNNFVVKSNYYGQQNVKRP